jgi:Na+-transporting NADH:ubiquinone oxidoreductase subunit NqrD
MKAASRTLPQITPWLWGINGVCSVLATTISIIIAMTYGITASYWTGFGCYVIAALSFFAILKKLPAKA